MRQGLVLFLLICGLSSVSFGQDPDLILTVNGFSVTGTMGATGSGSGTVSFDNNGASDVDGWSYGVCNDAALTCTNAADSALVSTINNGGAPGFGSTTFDAAGATQGIVIDLFGIQKLAPGTGYVFLNMDYDTTDPISADMTVQVAICNTLGTPPVADVIVIAGASIVPTEVPGDVSIGLITAPVYLRGDCNDDGSVDIADGVWNLNQLFQSGPAAPCMVACDANGDGMVDSADAIYTFNYALLDGPQPPAPFPACGAGDIADDCGASSCP